MSRVSDTHLVQARIRFRFRARLRVRGGTVFDLGLGTLLELGLVTELG